MSMLKSSRATGKLIRGMSTCSCQTGFHRHSFNVMFGENGNPPDVLVGKDVPIPPPEDGQVLVKMVAAPIHPADVNIIQGVYAHKPALPAVPGGEGVGVVEALGPNVTNLQRGDHVIPLRLMTGTWRSYQLANSQEFLKLDPNLDFVSGSTLSINPGTAYRMLKDYGTKSGDTVIQNGANSGVGQALIQIARSLGLKTVNVIRDRDDFSDVADDLTSLGADYVFKESELRKPEIKELWKKVARPSLAIDCVAGKSATELIRQLSPGGVLVNYGGMSKQPVTSPVSALIFKEITIKGFWFSQWRDRHPISETAALLKELEQLALKKELLPPRHELTKISDFKEAIIKAMTPFTSKKQILVMDSRLME